MQHSDIARLDDHTTEITINQFAAYHITFPESLRVTVPSVSLLSGHPTMANTTIHIAGVKGMATLSGNLLNSLSEALIRSSPLKRLHITLALDSWHSLVGANDFRTQALISGLHAHSWDNNEQSGWNNIVQMSLTYHHVQRLHHEVVVVVVPQFASYSLGASETITVTVPASSVQSQREYVVEPSFR